MDDKGQISAEYLLLIVVILTILSTVTIPLVRNATNAAHDVAWTSDSKVAVSGIANAVNIVHANGPGARRTLNVYIPRNGMNLTSIPNHLILNTTLTNGSIESVNSTVNRQVNVVNGASLINRWYRATIQWNGSNIAVTMT